jgi:hypothetical protein
MKQIKILGSAKIAEDTKKYRGEMTICGKDLG